MVDKCTAINPGRNHIARARLNLFDLQTKHRKMNLKRFGKIISYNERATFLHVNSLSSNATAPALSNTPSRTNASKLPFPDSFGNFYQAESNTWYRTKLAKYTSSQNSKNLTLQTIIMPAHG
jgi:hypothetical protein